MDPSSQATVLPPAETARHWGRLGVTLLVAWSCSLIWGLGVLTLTHGLLYSLGSPSDLVNQARPIGWTPQQGFLALAAGPTFLGILLARHWRGLLSGLLALPVSLNTPLVGLIAAVTGGILASLLGSAWPPLLDFLFYPVQHALLDWGPLLFTQGTVTVTVIAIVILSSTPASLPRRRGLGRGLSVGLLLTLVSCLGLAAIRQAVLDSWQSLQSLYWANESNYLLRYFISRCIFFYFPNAILHFLWQIPPLIWTTTVYFLEECNQSGRFGLLMWVVLVLATLGLPFVLLPLVPFP